MALSKLKSKQNYFMDTVNIIMYQLRIKETISTEKLCTTNDLFIEIDNMNMIVIYPVKYYDLTYQWKFWTSKEIDSIRNLQEMCIKHVIVIGELLKDSVDVLFDIDTDSCGLNIEIKLKLTFDEQVAKTFLVYGNCSFKAFQKRTLKMARMLKLKATKTDDRVYNMLKRCATNSSLWERLEGAMSVFQGIILNFSVC